MISAFRLIVHAFIAVLAASPLRADQAGDFDYYVLSLSWSPSYCEINGARDQAQCSGRRRYAFVVHGLWPQYHRGWPSFCQRRPAFVPNELIGSLRDIMPSKRLIIHQWKKHGSCSGLDLEGYFDLTRGLFAKVQIPARYLSPGAFITTTPRQLITDFVKTNRGLTPKMLSVQCGNRSSRTRLRELRICFSRQGVFRPCGDNERRACRAEKLSLPPVR